MKYAKKLEEYAGKIQAKSSNVQSHSQYLVLPVYSNDNSLQSTY